MKKLILLLFIFSLFSCQNREKKTIKINEKIIETQDTIVEKMTKVFKKPNKPIFKNLKIDTTYLFGIWTENRNNPHADFLINKDEFHVVDYDGDGSFPYLINENEIEIFYKDFSQQGLIYSVSKDSLIIMWNDNEKENKYIRFNNGYDYSKNEIIKTIDFYIVNHNKNEIDKDFVKNELNPKLVVLDKIIYDKFDKELFEKLCQLIVETNQNKRNNSTDILSRIYIRYQDKVYNIVYNDYNNKLLTDILEYSYIDGNVYKKGNETFILKMPDVERLRQQYKNNYYQTDLLYFFLRNNYQLTSKKKEIVKNNYQTDKRICSFKQEFSNIEYYLNKCGESGSVESIQIPKTDLETVRKWIELIYKVTDCDNCVKNKWDKSKMSFEPIDGGAGCYYLIEEINDRIEIKIDCGC